MTNTWAAFLTFGVLVVMALISARIEYVKWLRREELPADAFIRAYYPGRPAAEAASWLRAIIEKYIAKEDISRLRPWDVMEDVCNEEDIVYEVLNHLEIDYGSLKHLGGMGRSFDDVVQFLVKWTPR